MEVTILGAHNIESETARLAGVLIDGVLALDAGSLTPSLCLEDQRRLKAVFLTHHHYDHIRDIPLLGMSLYLGHRNARIFALPETLDILTHSFLNGRVYSDFLSKPPEMPTFSLEPVEPGTEIEFEGYRILPVSMPHSVPAVGYMVSVPGGSRLLYTGDSGPGFYRQMLGLEPQLLVVEVTASNRYTDFGLSARHLTPALLEAELLAYREAEGYIPDVVCVHMYPGQEKEIIGQLNQAAERLGTDIHPSFEGMQIKI